MFMKQEFKQALSKYLAVSDFDHNLPEYNTAYVSKEFPGDDFNTIFVYVKTIDDDHGMIDHLINQKTFLSSKNIQVETVVNRLDHYNIRTFIYTARS